MRARGRPGAPTDAVDSQQPLAAADPDPEAGDSADLLRHLPPLPGIRSKTAQLKETLLGMDAGLRPEDIDDTMLLFDKNRSGDISKHQFVQTIELLNTFA